MEKDSGESPQRALGCLRVESITIRFAVEADAPSIAAIYNHEVAKETSTFDLVARSVEEQRQWQAERSGAFTVIVAEIDGEIAGFGALSPYKERAAYRGAVEDSVYVRRDLARRGIGKALLSHLLQTAKDSGFHTVLARIATENEGSIALHRTLGFRLVGIEQEVGRKFNRWLDVALLQYMLEK
jgi:phosphinothricin acetyltransferase